MQERKKERKRFIFLFLAKFFRISDSDTLIFISPKADIKQKSSP